MRPLIAVAAITAVNSHADVLLLGLFRPDEQVGIYRAASQTANLTVFALGALNLALQPEIARLHRQQRYDELQRAVTRTARLVSCLAVAPFAVFALRGQAILSAVYGERFAEGAVILLILATGQMANALLGSVGALLNMTGRERVTARAMAIAGTANVGLGFALVPRWGGTGAALATATSYGVWNVLLLFEVRKRLRINPTAIGGRMNTV